MYIAGVVFFSPNLRGPYAEGANDEQGAGAELCAKLRVLLRSMPEAEDPSLVTQKETLVMPDASSLRASPGAEDGLRADEEDKENAGPPASFKTPHAKRAFGGFAQGESPVSVFESV